MINTTKKPIKTGGVVSFTHYPDNYEDCVTFLAERIAPIIANDVDDALLLNSPGGRETAGLLLCKPLPALEAQRQALSDVCTAYMRENPAREIWVYVGSADATVRLVKYEDIRNDVLWLRNTVGASVLYIDASAIEVVTAHVAEVQGRPKDQIGIRPADYFRTVVKPKLLKDRMFLGYEALNVFEREEDPTGIHTCLARFKLERDPEDTWNPGAQECVLWVQAKDFTSPQATYDKCLKWAKQGFSLLGQATTVSIIGDVKKALRLP